MIPELGIIEGFYGEPWSWAARAGVVASLAAHGYRFYLYAPKGDAFLRRRWQEPHPPERTARFAAFAAACGARGVRFGIGLSPYESYRDFGRSCRAALARKLEWLEEVGAQDLAILFDDMRGDVPDLADRQLEIVAFVAERSGAGRLFVCPTYYADDAILDRLFGARPARYLERLGEGLPPGVEIFWTGEEVISREYSVGHLRRVGDVLRRRPFLWDNYPANDGPRLSRYLHLRGVTGRQAEIGEWISGHGVNPAQQPVLSCIPAITLAESYRLGGDYEYGEAFRRAAEEVLGPELAALLPADVLTLQDVGQERIAPAELAALRAKYAASAHEGAQEIVRFLDGDYFTSGEVVQAQ
ncbi:MAG: hyaluronidase [Gemmatimonadetes bacterium]|nr:hyaluronidase [Gemmatimonadota bacterium]